MPVAPVPRTGPGRGGPYEDLFTRGRNGVAVGHRLSLPHPCPFSPSQGHLQAVPGTGGRGLLSLPLRVFSGHAQPAWRAAGSAGDLLPSHQSSAMREGIWWINTPASLPFSWTFLRNVPCSCVRSRCVVKLQLPTVVAAALMHPLPALFLSLSHFFNSLTMFILRKSPK